MTNPDVEMYDRALIRALTADNDRMRADIEQLMADLAYWKRPPHDFAAENERLQAEIARLRANETAQMDGALALLVADKNLRDEIERLRAAATPLCIGKPLIQILAKEGGWKSESGAAVIAADELFGHDPYDEIERLRGDNDKLRAEADHAIRVADLWKEKVRRALEGTEKPLRVAEKPVGEWNGT